MNHPSYNSFDPRYPNQQQRVAVTSFIQHSSSIIIIINNRNLRESFFLELLFQISLLLRLQQPLDCLFVLLKAVVARASVIIAVGIVIVIINIWISLLDDVIDIGYGWIRYGALVIVGIRRKAGGFVVAIQGRRSAEKDVVGYGFFFLILIQEGIIIVAGVVGLLVLGIPRSPKRSADA